MDNKNENLLKILVTGTPIKQIDKLVHTFTQKTPHGKNITGVDIRTKKIRVDDQNVKIFVFSPNIRIEIAMTTLMASFKHHFHCSSAVIFAFDKSDLRSFRSATVGLPKLARMKKFRLPHSIIPYALVGFPTESDAVTTHEAKEIAAKKNMSYFEITSTDRKAIKKIMFQLTRQALAV
jgi:hypothetical protein